jgi:hypothetical protein
VSVGVGVTLRVNGSTENLEKFAEQNGCRLEPNVDFQHKAEDLWVKEKVAKGNYVWLSCRERDAMQ